MESKRIKCISLEFPAREDGMLIYFEVGKNEVTEIKEQFRNGEMALIKYYEIYKNGELKEELHQFTNIIYF